MIKNKTTGASSLKKRPHSFSKKSVLKDFRICWISREVSLLGRKEVLTGKAKFGILGDGKEVAQIALSYAFQKGDHRSGYYRDQTWMLANDISSVEDFFAQLYADAANDPFSGGRQMNAHFATNYISPEGNWIKHTDHYNVSADVSNTGGQMARALGLALASKKYREVPELKQPNSFSDNGNEVCFCTIGDASTSEGVFWESINAAGVLKVPLAVFVWDDGYGISVPIEYQTTKGSISDVLNGFQLNENGEGIRIYKAKGWDYASLVQLFTEEIEKVRRDHIPAIFHISELTQPQGHSTSGSHERYKSKGRLNWEKDFDCLRKMEEWIITEGIASEKECETIKKDAKKFVKQARDRAWKAFNGPTQIQLKELQQIYAQINGGENIKQALKHIINPVISEVLSNARRMYIEVRQQKTEAVKELKAWIERIKAEGRQRYESHLYSNSSKSALRVPVVSPSFSEKSPLQNGYQILNHFFDKVLARNPAFMAFGEDVGKIGDVNQGFAKLQKKYGEARVFDTGIREWTIIGQAIGMAMRGLRPLAEIQYLDYLLYGLEPLSDDLATLRYRSNNTQQAPAIIRTRGHRLEGIWHSGSPLGMIINALRGIYVCVPRNMVQAVGFYNTLLQSDDPGLVIESLNGYRLKERIPDNIGEFTIPLGVPEILHPGEDVTLITYGSCVRIAQKALELLKKTGISVELIDVQTLLPFDLEHRIVESLKKTNRIVFMDEDVPGGATSYMLQQVLEVQNGYQYLDSPPVTLTATANRPPYGSDGDYFVKPNVEDVFDVVFNVMNEADPGRFQI